MMNLILSLFLVDLIFKGENSTYEEKNFNVGLYSDIYRPISFKLGMMIETTKLYILISI